MTKNSQKGFAQVVLLIIAVAVLIVGGGTYVALNSQERQQNINSTQVNPQVTKNSNQNIPPSITSKIQDWKLYTNTKLGFTISYPNTYHVYLDQNLINYDENKYERGNPNGVKIQVQKHSKENFGFDLSTSDGIATFIDQLNVDRANQITPFSLGIFIFKNKVLGGPGGTFDVYYTFSNIDTYYMVLVWGESNDQETINKILSTFTIDETIVPVSQEPSITLLSPNGGETWKVGTTRVISWKGLNPSKNSRVEISLIAPNGSGCGLSYDSSTIDQNQVSITLPAICPGVQGFRDIVPGLYKININVPLISIPENPQGYNDYSDAPFTITQ
jgi:hypothetical protein